MLFRSFIAYQYVAPNNHRTLPAERAIRTAKNHIISVLAACHVSFPSNRWPDLLPHIELTLNSLLSYKPNPSLPSPPGTASTLSPSILPPTPSTPPVNL